MPATAALTPSSCSGAVQVLEAARALFAEQGVDAVSMQDIATKAGVSKANVFHHFASKEALYIEVMRANVRNKSADIAALIASPAPFEQRFLALVNSQLRAMLADESGTRLVIREMTNGNVDRAKAIATQIFTDKVRERVAFFEDAQRRGELRDGIEPMACDMLLGACCMFHFNCRDVSQHLSQLIDKPGPTTPEAFAHTVCTVLSHGMCAPQKMSPVDALPKPRPPRRQTRPRKP